MMARDEGWMAEGMRTDSQADQPGGEVKYVTQLPSRKPAGKANLAMQFRRWRAGPSKTVGDDIADDFDDENRLRVRQTQAGFLGSPRHQCRLKANAMATIVDNTVFTNCARRTWLSGGRMARSRAPDRPGTAMTGPHFGDPAAHPNARFAVPAAQCPPSPRWEDPAGVPDQRLPLWWPAGPVWCRSFPGPLAEIGGVLPRRNRR